MRGVKIEETEISKETTKDSNLQIECQVLSCPLLKTTLEGTIMLVRLTSA